MKRLLRATTAWVTAATLLNPLSFGVAFAEQHNDHGHDWDRMHHYEHQEYQEPDVTLSTQRGTAGDKYARRVSGDDHFDHREGDNRYGHREGDNMSLREKVELLRKKVKYVFVLFQENRSYDHYFGTYPGANGLFSTFPGANPHNVYSQPGVKQSSFHSVLQDTDGTFKTISPFLIPRTIQNAQNQTVQLYPEDTYSVDHSHVGYGYDFHVDTVTKDSPKDDGYPLDQEKLHYSTNASGPSAPIVTSAGVAPTSAPTLQTKQKAEVVISHIDCDTIPFLWQYADRFVLFDNFHQTATGPSTPNAIAMIAGQVGDTQWVKHPSDADPSGQTLPNLTDSAPFSGSSSDNAAIQPPFGPDETPNHLDQTGKFLPSYPAQIPLTFASLPLSFMGQNATTITSHDQNSTVDLADVKEDIKTIAKKNASVDWGWYQQGYGPEPFDGQSIAENGGGFHWANAPEHASYIVHHNGPQYFGYLGDNPDELAHMHGLQQFYTDVQNQALPKQGGVFFVRGGYYNNDGLLPADPNPNVKNATPGNDDHPNYSDAQISEALVADSVNAIAQSKYWKDSAIIITYDETDGLYDHQPERFRTWGPDGLPETGGPRIPTIVISPYAKAHAISHVYSEHSSVIKFINELFGLVPLAELPDELDARKTGANTAAFNAPDGSPQTNLGPADALVAMGDLLEAFDFDRMSGKAPVLPASYAMIDPKLVHTLPHYVSTGKHGEPVYGCQALGISPTDYPGGYALGAEIDPPPSDFNPRPTQSPGNPYLNTNNNTGGASTGPWPN